MLNRLIHKVIFALVLLVGMSRGYALVSLSDTELSDQTGEGIVLALHDFRFMMKPTSYFEQVGTATALPGFSRGDLRWFGLNLSGAVAAGGGDVGFDWDSVANSTFGTACVATAMSCPRGGPIQFFSPHDNPYILRAFSPIGISYTGATLNSVPATPDKTIYEFLAPTAQTNYTMSWWGEIEVGRTGTNDNLAVGAGAGRLKSQSIIRGNASGSMFRLFQYTEPGNLTFAILYHSYLNGNFRFSVAQRSGATSDVIGVPVRFDPDEGMYFQNVAAYFPLGQLYYQAMTLRAVGTAGNFALDINSVPSATAAVYDSYYALRITVPDTIGYETARLALMGNYSGNNAGLRDYTKTHAYSRWGDWYPYCGYITGVVATGCLATPGTMNVYNTATDGVFFKACTTGACAAIPAKARRMTALDASTGTATYVYYSTTGHAEVTGGNAAGTLATAVINSAVINIGDSRIDGLLINQLHLYSCLGLAVC